MGAEYHGGVKLTLTVELEEKTVDAVDEVARDGESRSQTVQRLLHQSVAVRKRAELDDRDREIIDAHADDLNAEATDVLGYLSHS
jgi:metal-responsive CopG/Arc/MetJ family transcriptional regulator